MQKKRYVVSKSRLKAQRSPQPVSGGLPGAAAAGELLPAGEDNGAAPNDSLALGDGQGPLAGGRVDHRYGSPFGPGLQSGLASPNGVPYRFGPLPPDVDLFADPDESGAPRSNLSAAKGIFYAVGAAAVVILVGYLVLKLFFTIGESLDVDYGNRDPAASHAHHEGREDSAQKPASPAHP